MKHYGAVLTGDNNIVDGGESSVLTISGTSGNDKVVIYNQNDAATASEYAGDVITGDAKTGDAGPSGLVIVPSVAGRGATHILGADGREVEIAAVGGGVTAVGTIPVAHDSTVADDTFTGTADEYIASALSQSGAGASSVITVAGDLQVNGTTTTVNSTTVTLADKFLELGTASADFVATADSGGLLIVDQRSGGTNGYGGLRWNGSTSKFQFSSDTTNGTDGTWVDFAAGTDGIATVVGGAGVNVQTTTPADTNNPIVSVDLKALVTTAGATAPEGGLTFSGSGNSRTVQIGTDSVASGNLFATNDGAAGQVLSLSNDTTGQMTWVTVAGGTVQKYSTGAATKAAGDAGFTITAATHGLTGEDFTISMYELLTGSGTDPQGYSQILPQRILIHNGSTTGFAAGDVQITTGVTAADLAYKVIIKA